MPVLAALRPTFGRVLGDMAALTGFGRIGLSDAISFEVPEVLGTADFRPVRHACHWS